jgi:hypothetical protein
VNIVPWLKQLTITEEASDIRIIAIQELAKYSKNLPDLGTWIREIARQDNHSSVRSAAGILKYTEDFNSNLLLFLIERVIIPLNVIPDKLPWN